MRLKYLLLTWLMALTCQLASAQYWESGTTKTSSFYSYTSGKTTHSKTDQWYVIHLDEDGQVQFTAAAIGAVRIDYIEIYTISTDGETAFRTRGQSPYTQSDLKAGTYRIRVTGVPTDSKGYGGNFIVTYNYQQATLDNDPEPNDQWQDASVVASGTELTGHLGYYYNSASLDKSDWYKIEVPDEGVVKFDAFAETTMMLSYLEMYTLKADGSGIDYRNRKDMNGHQKDTIVSYEVPNVAPGTYYVKLDQWAGFGSYKLKYTFTPSRYSQDNLNNNSWQEAIPLSLDSDNQGRLGFYYNQASFDKEDWYRLEVKEDGKLTFTTKAEPTLALSYLELYVPNADETDITFRSRKDMYGQNKDTTVVYELPDIAASTYYIRIIHWDGFGGYDLGCYFTSHSATADPEPNNTWQNAVALRNGPAASGQLGYTSQGDLDVVDWYKIEVPDEGNVNLYATAETTLVLSYLEVFTLNEDGQDIAYRSRKDMNGQQKDTTVVFNLPDLKAGTYYLKLNRWDGYGTYSLQYVYSKNSRTTDPEPNNDWSQASLIEEGAVQTGALGHYYRSSDFDKTDWYKIEVPDEGTAVFATTTETSLNLGYLEVYTAKTDSTGTKIVFRNRKGMDGQQRDTTVVFTLSDMAPGTYYLKLDQWNGFGSYDLKYTFTPNSHGQDKLDNNSWEMATLIAPNTTQQGRLGHYYDSSSLDNTDWFYIEVEDEGTATFSTKSDTGLILSYLEVYTEKNDSTGTSMAFRNRKDMSGQQRDTTIVFEVPDLAPGKYYLKQGYYAGVGGYNLTYEFRPNVYGPDPFDNKDYIHASVIESGATQQGRLGYRYQNDTDTEDWYRFEVSSPSEAIFALSGEKDLALSYLELYTIQTDSTGTKVNFRNRKDMNYQQKDTTIVMTVSDLAPGTYYARQTRWYGQGGYALQLTLNKNPYGRDNHKNTDFANRMTLKEGEIVYNTLGYTYYNNTNTTDWYDLGMISGKQIDVTIAPDTTHTLSISYLELHKYTGDNEDGTPKTTFVKRVSVDRSQATLSYIDTSTEDSHYIVTVNRWYGNGGYAIVYGNDQKEKAGDMADNRVTVMAEGRNTVRKGVACENPITITNLSSETTRPMVVAVAGTENVDLLGFRMRGQAGSAYQPISDVTVMDEGQLEHTAVFVIPSLAPWEKYTFTLISEGKGDISYAPQRTEHSTGRNKIIISGTTFVVAAVMGYVDSDLDGNKLASYISTKATELFGLDEEERLMYEERVDSVMGQLFYLKKTSGISLFTIRTLIEKAAEGMVAALPTGKIAAGSTTNELQFIIQDIRERLWQWMFKDTDYAQGSIETLDAKMIISDVVASWDPNEMTGPEGVGEEHYIGNVQTVNYRILFENKAEAGDAAYRIRISDELDENVFDVSSVRFGETSHDGVGYNWEMTREGNKLSWDIKGIELPPNVNAPEGEGFVTFSVDLKPGLTDGTQLKNKATIIFDKNTPIETNEYVNTLDLTPPVTTMTNAAYSEDKSYIDVKWTSEDEASGVQHYYLYVAKDDGDYEYYGQSVTGSIQYPVEPGTDNSYHFYVLSTDNVGNTETTQPQAVEPTGKKGDVNMDGKVDISDIVAVINQIAGTASYRNADVNGDKKVDISDIVAIINIIAGQ